MTTGTAGVDTLAFDIFGTVLDLAGSLVPPLESVLAARGGSVEAPQFWAEWRARQRVEQYQDTLLMQGHSGYLETCWRALVHTAERLAVELTEADVASLVAGKYPHPQPGCVDGCPIHLCLPSGGSSRHYCLLSNPTK